LSDGIEVGDTRCYFKITDNHYHCDGDHYHYYFKLFDPIITDDELKIILEYCVRFIKNCKIDKLTGKFYLEGDEITPYAKNINDFAKLADLFEDVEHIKTLLNRCCVCHEWTQTSLKGCKHPVCLDCWRQLTVINCDDCDGDDPMNNCDKCQGLEKVQACPMCREYIIEGIE
jgi:hypothetical protein